MEHEPSCPQMDYPMPSVPVISNETMSIPSAPPAIIITDPHQRTTMRLSPKSNRRKYEVPCTSVELCISAQNLLDRDTFSKSDPVCVLYFSERNTPNWIEVGRTERVKNNLSPAWSTKFVLEYRFEERQMMKFAVYDWDADTNALSAHDFLGKIECSLGEIVAAPNKKFVKELALPRTFTGKSTLTIVAEELGDNKLVLGLKVNCRKVDKKDFFGKSDPYLVISKKLNDGTWTVIHKTEVIKNTLNPSWRPFTLSVASLTSGGNLERAMKCEVYDWNSSGSSEIIGEFETSYADITERFKENNASFELIHKLKQSSKKLKYKNSGILNIEALSIKPDKTFLDYIQNGLQLHFTVAVDFTASNGEPDSESSLHYRRTTEDNQYSLAIKAVGQIIQDYDYDKMFPAFGFGARFPSRSSPVSHRFPLTGIPNNPFCPGIDGVLDAYHHTLKWATLSGPTHFAPVIKHMAETTAQQQDGRHYNVLLIITDGIITDLEATKEAIIDASSLPMSIIIIGVGSQDFGPMEVLDSDNYLLRQYGKKAVRDIVQFVELQKFIAKSKGKNSQQYLSSGIYQHKPLKIHSGSKERLSRAVLAELPGQVVYWMKNIGPDSIN